MNKRIPLNALQKGLLEILKNQTTQVYDHVPKNAEKEYITIEEFTCKPNGAKNTDISDVSVNLHIWSNHKGKKIVNGIAEDVCTVVCSWPIDLSDEGYRVLSQDVDMFEAYEEATTGYHGVITFVAKIQNTRSE